jgi:hypothetical protein
MAAAGTTYRTAPPADVSYFINKPRRMNITFEPGIDQLPTRAGIQSKSGRVSTELFQARHKLMFEWSENAVPDITKRPVQGESARHQLFTGSSNLAQEAFYWFISAPALVYLLHLVVDF